MGVKKKLVELLDDALLSVDWDSHDYPDTEKATDILIAHGVTVQECKLGDKIYQTDGVRIYESTIGEITLTAKNTIFVTENIAFDERAIGKSIFLSYAEAESYLPKPPKGD